MPDRDKETLFDIQRAAEKINQFKQGLTRQGFLADEKTQSASLVCLTLYPLGTTNSLSKPHQAVPDTLYVGHQIAFRPENCSLFIVH